MCIVWPRWVGGREGGREGGKVEEGREGGRGRKEEGEEKAKEEGRCSCNWLYGCQFFGGPIVPTSIFSLPSSSPSDGLA